MEDVLSVYHKAYDPEYPIVCMDESSKQLIKEVREPLKARPGSIEKIDDEYIRKGVAEIFIAVEPLGNHRKVWLNPTRTSKDWAEFIKQIVDDYPQAKKVILVMDNLNTHKMSSLYQAFSPEEAYRIASKLEIHYTPRHGSWLNIAEIELSVLKSQCLSRRIPTMTLMKKYVKQWEDKRNQRKKNGVSWQFTTENARIKLKHLYPVL